MALLDDAKAVSAPLTGEAQAIKDKTENVREYENSMKPAGPTTPAAASTATVDKVNPKGKYGTGKGEVRIPEAANWAKGLPKYHKGVASVPKTGPAILKKGEKVIPAELNADNPDNEGAKMPEHTPAEKAHFHRAMGKLHQGGLHDHFGMKHDEPIPLEKKQEAAKSSNPHVAAMGRLAVAMHGWGHKK